MAFEMDELNTLIKNMHPNWIIHLVVHHYLVDIHRNWTGRSNL